MFPVKFVCCLGMLAKWNSCNIMINVQSIIVVSSHITSYDTCYSVTVSIIPRPLARGCYPSNDQARPPIVYLSHREMGISGRLIFQAIIVDVGKIKPTFLA